MSQIEREIKLLNVDVEKEKEKLKEKGIIAKGKYIQDVYTFDLPDVDVLYTKYVNTFITENDKKGLIKLITEIQPCLDEDDLLSIQREIGTESLLEYIENPSIDYSKLNSSKLIEVMKKVNTNFSKWVRLRQTGDQTTITIKKVVNGRRGYKLDAFEELEFEVPDMNTGRQFLEDLGYFFARHQIKMRMAYDYKNTEIVIDKWPHLKPYVEVEGPTKEEIDEAVEMLGFKISDEVIINTDDVYNSVGIDVYSKEYNDLSFNEVEQKEVEKYME